MNNEVKYTDAHKKLQLEYVIAIHIALCRVSPPLVNFKRFYIIQYKNYKNELCLYILYAFLDRSSDCDKIRYRDRLDFYKEDIKI